MFSTHGTGDAGIGDGVPEKYHRNELVTVGESGWSGPSDQGRGQASPTMESGGLVKLRPANLNPVRPTFKMWSKRLSWPSGAIV